MAKNIQQTMEENKMGRLIINLLGLAFVVPGFFYLHRLSEIFEKYRTYPNGEHLYPGAMIMAGGIIMLIGNVLYSKYKKRQKKLFLSVKSPMIRTITQ